MKTGAVIGVMALVGAGAAALYFATRPKKRIVSVQPQEQQQAAWSFQLPQLSSGYKTSSPGTPIQTSTPVSKPQTTTKPSAQIPSYYSNIDSIISSFSTAKQEEAKGTTPANNYVMADRRNPPTQPPAPEPTGFIDSIIKSFEPKPAISLLRPESRSPAQTPLRTPSFIDSIIQSFAPSVATPSRTVLQPSMPIQDRRIAYPSSMTTRPAAMPSGDDSPLAFIESVVKAVVEPVARIVEPLEEPRVVSAGLTPSPVTKFEKDVGFVSAFITSDGKRWLRDYRGAQYFSDEFHRSARAVADAAARSRRDGKSYSPG